MSAALPMPPERKFIEEEIPHLLEALVASQKPLWGKMSAQHMVEHVAGIFLMSAKPNHGIPVVVPDDRLERAIMWLESEKQFRRNTVAPVLPAEPLPLKFQDLQVAKTKFISALEKYSKVWRENPGMSVNHPAFGALTRRQWEKFHVKHVRHHFRQFELIPLLPE